jgi:hypothetical protein
METTGAAVTSIEMKENRNPRPLPNANNLPKSDVVALCDAMKLLLPPSAESSERFDKTPAALGNSEAVKESSTTLSPNAKEFTPSSKVQSSISSSRSSPLSMSTQNSKSPSTIISAFPYRPSFMTLPCLGSDNKVRQYLWKIDKVGDLLPIFNASIPPPRLIAASSSIGPSIVIPLHSNFRHASGGLIMDQLHHIERSEVENFS